MTDERILEDRVDVRSLPKNGHPVRIEASAEQRAALAARNGIPGIEKLLAELTVEHWSGDGYRVSGSIQATAVQECVVTLEPVTTAIDEPIDVTFVPVGSSLAREDEGELVLDPEGDDPPETFTPPYIEVGGLAEEMFALALDPYPRAADADLPDAATDTGNANPFAALAKLRTDGAS